VTKRRMSTEQMQDVLRQMAETDFAEQTNQHYQNEAQRVLKEEGAPEDALSTRGGLTPRARDAIEVLACIKAARASADNGRFDLAQAHAAKMDAVAMRAHMRLFEADVARGQKILAGSRRGHEMTYGTPDEKAQKYQKYQGYIDQLHRDHPDWKRGELNEKAASEFSVSAKTIERHTENPHK